MVYLLNLVVVLIGKCAVLRVIQISKQQNLTATSYIEVNTETWYIKLHHIFKIEKQGHHQTYADP